jgi:hypothetical protein
MPRHEQQVTTPLRGHHLTKQTSLAQEFSGVLMISDVQRLSEPTSPLRAHGHEVSKTADARRKHRGNRKRCGRFRATAQGTNARIRSTHALMQWLSLREPTNGRPYSSLSATLATVHAGCQGCMHPCA